MKHNLNRRQFMKSTASVAAVSTLGASSLKSLATNTKTVRNVIFFYVPHGAPINAWGPTMSGGELVMNECTQPYESVKQHCVFFDSMKTYGGLDRDLQGVTPSSNLSGPSLIEVFVEEFGVYAPIDFLPIMSAHSTQGYLGVIKGVPLNEDPWQTYNKIEMAGSNPYNNLIAKNIEHTQVLINNASGLDQDELIKYQTQLNESATALSVTDDMLDIPARRNVETPSQKTDYQILNTISALKTNKTNIVHFMTGETYNQEVLDGVGEYAAVINSNHPEYIIQRRAFDQKVADLIALLKDTNDSKGEPLIESTLVVLYSNEGDNDSHSNVRSPYLLAGGSFLNGGTINSSEDQDEFLDTIIALMGSSYPYSSDNGPLQDVIA